MKLNLKLVRESSFEANKHIIQKLKNKIYGFRLGHLMKNAQK
jgi:hypothetical protein